MMKKLKAILRILIALSIVAVVVIAIIKMRSRACEKIEVKFHYNGEFLPLDETGVTSMLEDAEIPIIGEELKNIPLHQVSNVLKTNPFVKEIEKMYFTGTSLVISILLKTPLLHIYPLTGEQYFMDEDGMLLPYSPNIKENLMVANGQITEQYNSSYRLNEGKRILRSLYLIAKTIHADPFYNAQFRQMYVNDNLEIELIPTVGNHIVLFGNEERISDKLFILQKTYTDALAYTGMDQYKQLDVRFRNRVIAQKR